MSEYDADKTWWSDNWEEAGLPNPDTLTAAQISKHLKSGSATLVAITAGRQADQEAAVAAQEETEGLDINKDGVVDSKDVAAATGQETPATDEETGTGEEDAESIEEQMAREMMKYFPEEYKSFEEALKAVRSGSIGQEETMSGSDTMKAQAYLDIWGEDVPEGYLEKNKELNVTQFTEQEYANPAYNKTEHYEKAASSTAWLLAEKLGGMR